MAISELKIIELKKLELTDLRDLIELWNKDPKDYNIYFFPFNMEYENLKKILINSIKNIYMGIFINKKIVGLFMLRGFDEGFDIPSYGVWISSQYSNKGLAKLTLQHSISTCLIMGIKKIMLKVHPENKIALNLYKKFGFIATGIDEKIGHIIMHKDLV